MFVTIDFGDNTVPLAFIALNICDSRAQKTQKPDTIPYHILQL